MVGKVLQPAVHGPPGDGGGEKDRYEHQPDEVAGQQGENIGHRGAKDFADADLFDALPGGEGGETQEAETGDQDGDDREEEDEGGCAAISPIEVVEGFVEKGIVEGFVGNEL